MQDPLQHLSGRQAIEWAPRIDAAQRDDFEAAQRREVPDFAIRDLDAHPAGWFLRRRLVPDYYPLTYLEPLSPNLPSSASTSLRSPSGVRPILRTIA